jgi:hypothetical protein
VYEFFVGILYSYCKLQSIALIMPYKLLAVSSLFCLMALFSFKSPSAKQWQSKFVKVNPDGTLQYIPDEKGNVFPDFSRVGYYAGDKSISDIAIVKTVKPSDDDEATIQAAIDEVSKRPLDQSGFRGTILLSKGVYKIPGTIKIEASGIVLRGEGDDANGTTLIATGTTQRSLLVASGKGNIREVANTRVKITDAFVPVGATSFNVSTAKGFKAGDRIILYRPGTEQWIKDLKMDQIDARNGTKQWQANEYNLQYERVIQKIEGNKIYLDNPVVLEMEPKYGGGEIFKYTFEGRINNVGVEKIYFESEYLSDTAENHGWTAVQYDRMENGWVRNVTSKYFGYSCVHLDNLAKNISVLNSNCFEAKSVITGSRRYSFNNDGQQNLFINCHSTDGRHDYVTGAKVCGPNVFYDCTAKRTHADIGPHHRWSTGTLYDNINTDGEINIQDRGNYGSGHGWVGVTQILWNCKAKTATVQSPYVNGKNYSIGLTGNKTAGRFKDRPDGVWEGQNQDGLQPPSLYIAQLEARKKGK